MVEVDVDILKGQAKLHATSRLPYHFTYDSLH